MIYFGSLEFLLDEKGMPNEKMLELEKLAVIERFEYFIDDMIFANNYTRFSFSDDMACIIRLGLRRSYQNVVLFNNEQKEPLMIHEGDAKDFDMNTIVNEMNTVLVRDKMRWTKRTMLSLSSWKHADALVLMYPD